MIAAVIIAIIGSSIGEFIRESNKTLNDYIAEDIHSVIDTIPDPEDHFIAFYEVETVLNNKLTDTTAAGIDVDYYKLVIQVDTKVYHINRDFINKERGVETLSGHWGGCFKIDDYNFNISFEDALKAVYESELKTPDTKYMTIRRPIGTRYENPIYIFGNSRRTGLCVDTKTGEVKMFE